MKTLGYVLIVLGAMGLVVNGSLAGSKYDLGTSEGLGQFIGGVLFGPALLIPGCILVNRVKSKPEDSLRRPSNKQRT
jgi:hypothetical protein